MDILRFNKTLTFGIVHGLSVQKGILTSEAAKPRAFQLHFSKTYRIWIYVRILSQEQSYNEYT